VSLHEPCAEDDYLARLRTRDRRWAYDAAFGPDATSADVYAASAAPLVADVAAGAGNATVFCYGATGAGKTHTMLGTAAAPGVMVLAIGELFERLGAEPGAEVRLAYLEIYNENVRDLFAAAGCSGVNPSGGVKPSLELREDPLAGVVVSGLTCIPAGSAAEVLHLLQRGNGARVTEPTRANATSSRSHAVLQVFVRRACFAHTSKLSLIDLAGSERALATDIRTVRSAEGAHINKSLLALSSCIHALVEGRRHIPFRNSRLTQLLKDSLGGGCRTAMIANVSPAGNAFGESSNTLHWADRAKEIRTAPAAERDAAEEAAAAREAAQRAAAAEEAEKEAEKERMQEKAEAAEAAASENAEMIAALRAENDALRRRMDAAAAVPMPMQCEAPTPGGCFSGRMLGGGEEAAAAVVASGAGGRARTRRRVGDGPSAALFSPGGAGAACARPPFLTASAPNLIVSAAGAMAAAAAAACGATPARAGGASRAALYEETETLRELNAELIRRTTGAEERCAELEAAVDAAAAAAEADRAEFETASAAWAQRLEASRAEADALRRALTDARGAEAAAARAAAAAQAQAAVAQAAIVRTTSAAAAMAAAAAAAADDDDKEQRAPAVAANAPSLEALLSPAGARLRAARRASLAASASLAFAGASTGPSAAAAAPLLAPPASPLRQLSNMTNGDDAVAPLSAVKAAVRSFEGRSVAGLTQNALAPSPMGTMMGTTATRPVPPSPGRIMSTRLYQRFAEAAAAQAASAVAGAAAAASPAPLARTGSALRS
jgi:kinesin family protein 18/19